MPRSHSSAPRRSAQRLRIIGGQWRGRRLEFVALEGLRPTPDRVRETLFNWLQPLLPGARGLDLFAGSGALGLEALSRGAAQVVFIDSAATAVRQIEAHLSTLGSPDGHTRCADALGWLRDADVTPFDIVFLDPPFHRQLLAPAAALLAERGWLAPGARIYLEAALDEPPPELPASWECLREKRAGQVCYRLYRCC